MVINPKPRAPLPKGPRWGWGRGPFGANFEFLFSITPEPELTHGTGQVTSTFQKLISISEFKTLRFV